MNVVCWIQSISCLCWQFDITQWMHGNKLVLGFLKYSPGFIQKISQNTWTRFQKDFEGDVSVKYTMRVIVYSWVHKVTDNFMSISLNTTYIDRLIRIWIKKETVVLEAVQFGSQWIDKINIQFFHGSHQDAFPIQHVFHKIFY